MNTKQCVYKNCGNTSAFATKITFFGFPLKDSEKSQLWAQMAGCENINLKSKFLCENHFSTIYISKTPRRTVLLPNAVPYRWDETSSKDESYNEEYNAEKNASTDEILMESELDEENDIIYTNNIEMMRHNERDDEHVETLEDVIAEDEVHKDKPKIKFDSVESLKHDQKRIDQLTNHTKNIQKHSANRVSLTSGDFVNHVTKRQKLQTSTDNISMTAKVTNPLKLEKKPDVPEEKPIQIDNTIDNPDITTFIYKGEEYIQMPKRIYLQQRAKLDADAKRYQNIVQNIKSLVNATD